MHITPFSLRPFPVQQYTLPSLVLKILRVRYKLQPLNKT